MAIESTRDLCLSVAGAIREKKGSSELINPQDFAKEIASIEGGGSGGGGGTTPSKPKWTGHADAEGLRAIGWTDEDIAYYQANGVNWDEEDDEYHKVTDDNKALYGVLTANNISTYRDRIVYLPKIDTSKVTNMYNLFGSCGVLIALPMLDTSKVTNMSTMFNSCSSLISIPPLDTGKVTNMSEMFRFCISLKSIPKLNTSKVTNMSEMFRGCKALTTIPRLDTSRVTNMDSMFYECSILTSIPRLDTSSVTDMNNIFYFCYCLTTIPMLNIGNKDRGSVTFQSCNALTTANFKNLKIDVWLASSKLLSKESILYIINNEAATSAITITLASYAYDKWANDADVVAALTNHPNISLSK